MAFRFALFTSPGGKAMPPVKLSATYASKKEAEVQMLGCLEALKANLAAHPMMALDSDGYVDDVYDMVMGGRAKLEIVEVLDE